VLLPRFFLHGSEEAVRLWILDRKLELVLVYIESECN